MEWSDTDMDYRDEYDEDDLSNHHPTCRGGCGQLADECECRLPKHLRTLNESLAGGHDE